MQVPRPSDADKEFFRSIVPAGPGVEVKPMFGNLGAFVNGNMFAGLFGSDVGVKLDADGRDALREVEGSGPFGPAERPMGGYLSLPSAWRDAPDLAEPWLERAMAYVATLPPKVKKAAKKK
jgi:TfoX/Sxy family transcriptional regulator of competence genes